VVYAASSLSLAAWEVFVHLGIKAEESSLIQFMAIQAEIPDSVLIEQVLAHQLPQNWKTDPAPQPLQEVGNTWLKASTTSVLRVPSVVIPQENNYLRYPEHPESAKIIVTRLEPFVFDPRVWRK
jgi:RES domain-containing protein